MSSIGKLMRQAQKIQSQMETIQAALANKTLESTAGGGAIKIVVNCDGTLRSLKINPDAVNKDDVPFLEDMLVTGINAALVQAKEHANKEMGSVTQGLGMPGLF
ncbi:MAG TPA: YbaB/EbfC family nucleoid-associated protein [Candidatus Limnocylindria bacterium]|nr:YbaB/EbfC family nucleoid-associated protein [Candidatus Limnocylindria bacterium]